MSDSITKKRILSTASLTPVCAKKPQSSKFDTSTSQNHSNTQSLSSKIEITPRNISSNLIKTSSTNKDKLPELNLDPSPIPPDNSLDTELNLSQQVRTFTINNITEQDSKMEDAEDGPEVYVEIEDKNRTSFVWQHFVECRNSENKRLFINFFWFYNSMHWSSSK